MKIFLSHEANKDLENIYTDITERQQAPMQAVAVMNRIYDVLDHIANNPLIGFPTGYSDTYEFVIGDLPINIVYRVQGNTIEVVTAFHTAQSPDKKRLS